MRASVAASTTNAWTRRAKPLLALVTFFPIFLFWRPQRDIQWRSGDLHPPAFVEKLILRLAAHDWLLCGYLLTLLCKVVATGGRHHRWATACIVFDLAVFIGAVYFVRRSRPTHFLSSLVYRLGVLTALLGSFLELQWILPAASGPAVDGELHAIDLRLFGIEPALAFERFVSPQSTEWFSFFYYGYFPLLAAHVLPLLFLGKDQRVLTTFGFGILWLYCVGHVFYTVVPAYGPYAHLAFQRPLEGALWWPLVKSTVASVDGSARTDVFPSLHTAGSVFLVLYAFKARKSAPFKYTWLPLAFVVSQIVVATMFLRWHYLIDICAGLVLAWTGIIAGEAALWWDEGRIAAGGQASWPR